MVKGNEMESMESGLGVEEDGGCDWLIMKIGVYQCRECSVIMMTKREKMWGIKIKTVWEKKNLPVMKRLRWLSSVPTKTGFFFFLTFNLIN